MINNSVRGKKEKISMGG